MALVPIFKDLSQRGKHSWSGTHSCVFPWFLDLGLGRSVPNGKVGNRGVRTWIVSGS